MSKYPNDINVVIGTLRDDHKIILEDEHPIAIHSIFLPTVLCALGFFQTNSQIKRDRPDLFIEVPMGLTTFDDSQKKMFPKDPKIFKSLGKTKRSVFIWRD